MNTRTVVACALILAVADIGAAQNADLVAQQPASRVMPAPAGEPIPAPSPELVPPPTPSYHNHTRGLSHWITYTHPDCCGPLGGHGLVQTELFLRPGIAFPLWGGILQDRLDTGWAVEAGGRSLIFDAAAIRAWTIDFSVTNIWNNGQGNQVPFFENGVAVTVRDLNRTFANFGLGREYFLLGSAQSCDQHWRAGWDAGIHYGSSRLGLNDPTRFPGGFRRLNSWEWGPFVALHTDYEIQYGCVSFLSGFRVEWSETFMNRLVTGFANELANLSLLWNFAVRY